MLSTFRRSLLVPIAVLAFAAPASAQQATGDVSPVAPVCSGVGENGPSTCSSGDASGAVPQGAVGGGQVITDPADQVYTPTAQSPSDGDIAGDAPDGNGAAPQRGEQHVLAERRSSTRASSGTTNAASPRTGAATQPVAARTTATATRARAGSAPRELPFTGVNAGYLALVGSVLLAGGIGLRRTLRI